MAVNDNEKRVSEYLFGNTALCKVTLRDPNPSPSLRLGMLRRLAPGPILAALIASRPYIPNMRRILSTVTRRGPGRGVGDGSVPIRASISDQNGVHPLLVLATPLGNPEDISLRGFDMFFTGSRKKD
eukprot:455305-Amorphochlora_amoeboformis.AAC.1